MVALLEVLLFITAFTFWPLSLALASPDAYTQGYLAQQALNDVLQRAAPIAGPFLYR